MTNPSPTCPATRSKVIELYFMEHRAKLLDIAAFLDRLDRAENESEKDDFRLLAFRKALRILHEDRPGRAKRVHELFSDLTDEPIDKAPMQGALGAAPNRDYAGGGET